MRSGEMEGRKEKSHYLYRPQMLFIWQTLVHCTNREGFRTKVGLLMEGYVSLKYTFEPEKSHRRAAGVDQDPRFEWCECQA